MTGIVQKFAFFSFNSEHKKCRDNIRVAEISWNRDRDGFNWNHSKCRQLMFLQRKMCRIDLFLSIKFLLSFDLKECPWEFNYYFWREVGIFFLLFHNRITCPIIIIHQELKSSPKDWQLKMINGINGTNASDCLLLMMIIEQEGISFGGVKRGRMRSAPWKPETHSVIILHMVSAPNYTPRRCAELDMVLRSLNSLGV